MRAFFCCEAFFCCIARLRRRRRPKRTQILRRSPDRCPEALECGPLWLIFKLTIAEPGEGAAGRPILVCTTRLAPSINMFDT